MFVLVKTKRDPMADHLTPTVFKCQADYTRVRLMLLITREEELCVCELTCALDESQPKVSRHLAQLRSAGRSPARLQTATCKKIGARRPQRPLRIAPISVTLWGVV